MKKIILVILSLLVISAVGQTEEITLSQGIDKHDIPFEDSVIFTITLRWPGPQHAYLFDRPLSQYIDRLKVRGFSSSISSALENGEEFTTKTYRYSLIPTSSGEGLIDSMSISYITWPDSIPGMLMTEPMTVTIGEPKLKETSSTKGSLWWYLLGGVIVIGGIVVFVILKRAPQEKEKVLSAEQLALVSLMELKEKAGGDLKQFQTGLFALLAVYLKHKFNVSAQFDTDDELMERLKKTSLTDAQIEQIHGWLVKAQKDKFAPVNAAPGETLRLEAAVKQFFEKM